MKNIPLRQGLFALVDDEDYEALSNYRWKAVYSVDIDSHYAIAKFSKENKRVYLMMHRVILRAKKNQYVDHRNHDTLDNRKQNIRIATASQNAANSRIGKANTSGYKGVSYFPYTKKKWRAYITLNQKQTILGYFDTKEQAALAYNQAAISLFGEFAFLNKLP